MSVGVVIPTYNGACHIKRCLDPILASPLKPKILVIDSSSTDKTAVEAKKMGVEVRKIPKGDFNHGLTREMGRKALQTEVVVMLTQDAYAVDPHVLEKLVAPLKGEVSFSYARQIPHKGAGYLEAFSRSFNYPEKSEVRSLEDVPRLGSGAFFCSNSCAAYRNACLDEIGGFPEVEFGEDAHVAARLLHKGHKIAYVAEAEVYHSHCYSLREEFQRHLLIGRSRRPIQHLIGSDTNRGREYVKALFKKLWKEKPSLIPYACLQTFAKWLGYRLG